MRTTVLAIMVAVLGMVACGEASARCCSKRVMQGRNCSCQCNEQTPMRQWMRDGSCLNGSTPQEGTGQGRRMGMGNRFGAAPASDQTQTPAPAPTTPQ